MILIKRIKQLKSGFNTFEIKKKEIINSKKLKFTNDVKELINVNCYIITVPTPINRYKARFN